MSFGGAPFGAHGGGGGGGEGKGKPCRVCPDMRKLLGQASHAAAGAASARAGAPPTGAERERKEADAPKGTAGSFFSPYPLECPPDADGFGRATWTFLHSMAAYYPDEPTPAQQGSAKRLLSDFATLYPCGSCAEHMGGYLKTNPPRVGSQSALALWMCEMHNEVNERLGKPVFDCRKVNERWRDGPPDGSCDDL